MILRKDSKNSSEQAIELENAEVLDEIARMSMEELGKVNIAIERLQKVSIDKASYTGILDKAFTTLLFTPKLLIINNKTNFQTLKIELTLFLMV